MGTFQPRNTLGKQQNAVVGGEQQFPRRGRLLAPPELALQHVGLLRSILNQLQSKLPRRTFVVFDRFPGIRRRRLIEGP